MSEKKAPGCKGVTTTIRELCLKHSQAVRQERDVDPVGVCLQIAAGCKARLLIIYMLKESADTVTSLRGPAVVWTGRCSRSS